MATLTDAQIAGAAQAAGFTGDNLAKAVAIALAESGGNPNAHNAVPPDNSYGLWQINMLGSMGPARRKQFGLSKNEDLYNPTTNAKAAFAIAGGGKSFGAWSTYTSGAFLRYMSRARKAANQPDSAGGTSTVTQAGFTDGISAVGDFFEFISNPVTWLRLGMIVSGGVLVVISLYMLSGQGNKAMALAGTATDFIPGGGVAKKVIKAGA